MYVHFTCCAVHEYTHFVLWVCLYLCIRWARDGGGLTLGLSWIQYWTSPPSIFLEEYWWAWSSVCVHICMCVCAHVWLEGSMCVCMHMCGGRGACVCACTCVEGGVHVCACMCVCAFAYDVCLCMWRSCVVNWSCTTSLSLALTTSRVFLCIAYSDEGLHRMSWWWGTSSRRETWLVSVLQVVHMLLQ